MVCRFGDCELDAARFELRRAGQAVPVEPQVLELLLYLVAHRDRAVTRAELFDKLWRGRIVTDAALNSRIKAARSAIGDDGVTQTQIRTLHRTGYRFVGHVEELPAADVAVTTSPAVAAIDGRANASADFAAQLPRSPSAQLSAPPPRAPFVRRPLRLVGAALGLLIAVALFSLLPRDPRDIGQSTAVASSMSPPTPNAFNDKSLAVLPFANLSTDPEQEYIADGISVELTNVLSHLPDLQVVGTVSSFHFEGRNESLNNIGVSLGVANLLTGSVQKAGEGMRITVELIDTASGYQLWSESYDRGFGDILDVYDEISGHVAAALKVRLGLGESGEIGMTRNIAAYDEFLRGAAQYGQGLPEANARAIEHMHRAIALDPAFSRAWSYLYCIYRERAGLVSEESEDSLRKASEALEQARKLTPEAPFVRILTAHEHMVYGRRLEAGATLDALPAGYWTADRYLTRDVFRGRVLIANGHAKPALEALERGRAIDPLSAVAEIYLGLAHTVMGNTAQAYAAIDRGLELGSSQRLLLGNAILVALGTDDAAEIRRRVAASSGSPDVYRQINEALVAHLGDPDQGRAEVRRIAAESVPPDYVRSVLITHWAAYYGDAELALAELDTIAHASPDEGLLWRPVLSEVRKLSGFKEIVRREGLVEYWQAYGWGDFCQPTTGDDFECR